MNPLASHSGCLDPRIQYWAHFYCLDFSEILHYEFIYVCNTNVTVLENTRQSEEH